jgi:REP element-mobilizing transposase RayT
MQQLGFKLKGPKRKPRRGRPRKKDAGVSHLRRPALASRFPVHVTLRVRKGVWPLRTKECFRELRKSFAAGRERFGFRLNQFSVQGNHVHLIAEAADGVALSRGMQGLTIRMAKSLNRVMRRRGKVFADRFHSRILRTPTEVRNAIHYVLFNRHHHAAQSGRTIPRRWRDPYSSAHAHAPATDPPPISPPHTWLLRQATDHL